MHPSKLIGGVAIVAGLGLATTQLAAAEGPRASAAQGGLSVTPSILETTARSGAAGSATITNSTGRTLRMIVRARPWRRRAAARWPPTAAASSAVCA